MAELSADLVEYMIVVIPEPGSLMRVASAVSDLVRSSLIRILDAVVLVRGRDDSVQVHEIDDVDGFDEVVGARQERAGWLTDHDIQLLSLPLAPGTTALALVVEDKWAEPLSAAACAAGGEIIGGERIPARRVKRVLLEGLSEGEG